MTLCPRCGVEPITWEAIQVWELDYDQVARSLTEFCQTRTCGREIPDVSWSLGRKGNEPLVYIRRLDEEESVLRQYYAHSPNTCYILSTEERAQHCRTSFGWKRVISLEVLCTAEEPELFPALLKSQKHPREPKPRLKRGERLAKIEKFQNYLVLLVRSLYEIIRTAEAEGRVPKIPPRPSQRKIAEQLGLTQSDISHCLRDPSAPLLRLLWENCTSTEGILRMRGRI